MTTPLPIAPDAYDRHNEEVTRSLIDERLGVVEGIGSSFYQAGAGAVSRSWLSKVRETCVTPQDFGAAADGTTDDSAAFAAALAAANAVYIPAGTYRLASTLTIGSGNLVYGEGLLPGGSTAGLTVLKFDLSVTPCIQLGAASSNGQVALKGVRVERASGSVPAGSIGVHVLDSLNVLLDEVQCWRHAVGFKFEANTVYGIGCAARRLFTGVISEHHVEIDSWPELRVSQSRFGSSGANDVACTSYVKITGGDGVSAGIGPNTIHFTDCQFNQGNSAPDYWTYWTAIQGEGSTATIFTWSNCHIEGVGTAAIKSEADVSMIHRLLISGCTFNITATPFFALNAATKPSEWCIADNTIAPSTFNLAPTDAMNSVKIHHNRISGTATITGASGSTLQITGNTMAGNWTLDGSSNWGLFVFSGNLFTSGSPTFSNLGGTYHIPHNKVHRFPSAVVFNFDDGDVSLTHSSNLLQFSGGAVAVTNYTVANLPATATAGGIAFATNGRKNGEGAGAGTGVLVFGDGTAWRACDTGATVAA